MARGDHSAARVLRPGSNLLLPRRQNSPVTRVTAFGLFVLVVLFWGANWPVMKVGLAYIGPFQFALARMSMGALILFAVAYAVGQLRLPSRHDWRVVVSVGIVQMGLFMAISNVALQFVPAGRSALLAYTTLIWVIPLAMLLLGESMTKLKILGLVLGFSGVLVLFNPAAFDWTDGDVLFGNGMLLFAALLWAVLIVQIRGHRWEGTPLSLLPWQFSVAVLVLLPLSLWFDGGRQIEWSATLGVILFYNGPIATAFCFWAMITITRALPAATTSIGTLGVPVVGMLASAVAIGESVTATSLAGLLLILGGLLAAIIADRPGTAN